MSTPNLGRMQKLSLVLQVAQDLDIAGTPFVVPPPTTPIRVTGGSDPTPTPMISTDNYANGSLYELPATVQGFMYDGKSINGEADPDALALFAQSMFGLAAAGTGAESTKKFITPLTQNFDDYVPGIPIAGEWQFPNAFTRFWDGQVTQLQITMNMRGADANANFQFSVNFNARKAVYITAGAETPITSPLPGGAFGMRLHSVKIGGVTYKAETSQITLQAPLQSIDGTGAGDYLLGYERNGMYMCDMSFQRNGVNAADGLARLNQTQQAVEWTLEFGSGAGLKLFKVLIPAAQIRARDVQNGLDRITSTVSVKAISPNGIAAPFRIEVTGSVA